MQVDADSRSHGWARAHAPYPPMQIKGKPIAVRRERSAPCCAANGGAPRAWHKPDLGCCIPLVPCDHASSPLEREIA